VGLSSYGILAHTGVVVGGKKKGRLLLVWVEGGLRMDTIGMLVGQVRASAGNSTGENCTKKKQRSLAGIANLSQSKKKNGRRKK